MASIEALAPAQTSTISAVDIAAMVGFVGTLNAVAAYRDGTTIKRMPAAFYRVFWRTPEPENASAALMAQRKAAAEAALKRARFRLFEISLQFQQANSGARRVSPELLDQWHREAAHWNRVLVGANEALARGGFEAMGDPGSPQWLHAEQTTGKRLAELETIAERAQSGGYGPAAQSRQFVQHVGQVADFALAAYENTRIDHLAETRGHNEFKRLLGAADHCTNHRGRIGCIQAAGMGWVSREDLIEIGECSCYGACHCTIISRRVGRNARLGIAQG